MIGQSNFLEMESNAFSKSINATKKFTIERKLFLKQREGERENLTNIRIATGIP